jgi:hypothetical protein
LKIVRGCGRRQRARICFTYFEKYGIGYLFAGERAETQPKPQNIVLDALNLIEL